MEHPKIEILNESIVDWIQKNFVKAMMQFHIMKEEFKFARVVWISKVWKENDYWIVEALIEYVLGTDKMKTIVFQVDGMGTIVGYNIPKPSDL